MQDDKLKPGSFAHEYAHRAVRGNQFSPELKKCLRNALKSGYTNEVYHDKNGTEWYRIYCSRFIRKYQGRTYIPLSVSKKPEFKPKLTDFEEYPSVGYETYITNPNLLKQQDPELYYFFKNGGLALD